jgi:4-hydroxy-tetrahydrodipicolinate synthase
MATAPKFVAKGVIPATLIAFDQDYVIDQKNSIKHLRDVVATDRLSAITVNGHASEIHACSFAEQQELLALSLAEVGDRLPLVNGVYADGSYAAVDVARMAAAEGASALLVFPPNSMSMGGQLRSDMALRHFAMIAEATDLPLILFQYPQATGLGYPFATMQAIFDAVPSIVAIKDWCNDPMLHEKHIRDFQSRQRPVNVLTTHSSWLMASLSMGPAGLLSGAGSVIADLQVALFEAIQANDLAAARAVNDRIYPLAQAFYRAPFLDMHNRMKVCLQLLGRIDAAVVRPPLMPLTSAETEDLKAALVASGLLLDA